MTRSTHTAIGLVLWSTAALGPVKGQQYVISTYAGGGIPPVNPISALQTSLDYFASTIAADAQGNAFFANGNAVFKLDGNGTVTRIAGSGTSGFSGDGGPAVMARLQISAAYQSAVQGLSVDRAGNLFIGDIGNHRIRRVSPDGIIVTIAGNGAAGSAGDGGAAVDAQLGEPSGIAVDSTGNLFIADSEYNVVRKVALSGLITTVAGVASPEALFAGDGGPATKASLAFPRTVALDLTGTLFIADSGNHRIRKVSPDGTITTIAGNDARALNGTGSTASGLATSIALDWPTSLAVDGHGNLFIADPVFQVIRKVTPRGMLTPVAGNGSYGFSGDGGPANKAQLTDPWSVALDGRDNLFIGCSQRIRQVLATGTINTVAGGGTIDLLSAADATVATNAQLKLALPGVGVQSGLATDRDGSVFLAETGSGFIRKITPDGRISTVAGASSCFSPNACPLGDGGPATSAHFRYPTGVAVDAKGNLFIADAGDYRIRKVSPTGTITTVAGNGTGGFTGDGGLATDAQISALSVTVDTVGNLFLVESSRVRKVSPDGIITSVAGGDGANAMAVDAAGNLLIAGNSNDDFNCYFFLRKVSSSGTINTLAGVPGPCEAAGDDGLAVNAALGFSSSIAVDGAGNVFLTDYNEQRIRRISPGGIIATVAGGHFGYSGDGGPAVNAAVNYPIALAADGAGDVYFSDAFNEVIRVLRPFQNPTLSAVVDAASQNANPISPGKIVILYGAGLGPAQLVQNQPGNGRFGTATGGTAVSFNGIAAPVVYASDAQVAVVVPYAIGSTTAQVTVTYQGAESPAVAVPVAPSAPGLFTSNQTGSGQAAAVNADGTVNAAGNPAHAGDVISLYATGEGQTSPPGVDGRLGGLESTHPLGMIRVTVGGLPATVQYAGGVQGLVAGMMQLNVRIPRDVEPGGYVPVVLQVGNASTTPGAVWIAVAGN